MRAGLALFSTGLPYTSPHVQDPLSAARKAVNRLGASEVEKAHVEALDKWVAKESMHEAVGVWEDILSRHPRDELAVKFAHDAYFFLGKAPEMKQSLDRVLGEWERSANNEHMFGYLLGMSAFSLEENLCYEQAERRAKAALAINPRDTWSIHALAHVHEMQGKQEEGINFLTEEMANWKWCTGLACHLWWHMTLHYVEKGKHQQALQIFDHHIAPLMKSSGAMLDLVDAASLLQRIEFDGGSVGDRWKQVAELFAPHQNDHVLAYNDVHHAVALLGAGDKEGYARLMSSLNGFAQGGNEQQAKIGNRKMTAEVAEPLCKAFAAYRDKDYEKATSLLLPLVADPEATPLVHSFVGIGGSNAQRDLFAQLFLWSLGQSNPQGDRKHLLDVLAYHRSEAKGGSSPLTQRMIHRLLIAPFTDDDDITSLSRVRG